MENDDNIENTPFEVKEEVNTTISHLFSQEWGMLWKREVFKLAFTENL